MNETAARASAQSFTAVTWESFVVPGRRGAHRLQLGPHAMRVLEARFHPQQKTGGEFIVVGHVVWDGASARPVVQPSQALLARSEPATLLSKLQYLVASSGQEAFDRLQVLRSQFWSFVEIPQSSLWGGTA
jgi:hypothetical protein